MGMRKAIRRMGAFDGKHDCINVVIETPKGSRVKYGYNERNGILELKKALPEGMVFPFNFEYFFVSYNKLADKEFRVLGRGGEKKALTAVRKGQKNIKKA
jgi:inorganic pyrophosphatase